MSIKIGTVRIRGRVTNKNEINDFYPKFKVINEVPFLQETYETWESLDANSTLDDKIFEPIESGLGTRSSVMYATTNQRTFMFIYSIDEITWGSEVVSFGDPVNFLGETLLEE